jgi:hypothetical protein
MEGDYAVHSCTEKILQLELLRWGIEAIGDASASPHFFQIQKYMIRLVSN